MIKNLYDEIAKRWYREGGTIWFYSDPHFNDPESAHFRKNYPGDDEQVRRINSKVGKNDTIVFLGDIGDVSYIKKIKGYKVLILGNHDKGETYYKRTITETFSSEDVPTKELANLKKSLDAKDTSEFVRLSGDIYGKYSKTEDNRLFDEVYKGCLIISDKIILSHEPIKFEFAFNIHGHDHGMAEGYNDEGHFNCCAEHIGYYPVCIKEIINSGKLKDIPDIHRTTIDNAIIRKNKREKKD